MRLQLIQDSRDLAETLMDQPGEQAHVVTHATDGEAAVKTMRGLGYLAYLEDA